MFNVVVMKLTNGDEVIAKVIDVSDTHFEVNNPRVLMLQDAGGGRMGASFVPMLLLGEDEGIIINRSGIAAWTYKVAKAHSDHYLQSVSNIEIVSSLGGLK